MVLLNTLVAALSLTATVMGFGLTPAGKPDSKIARNVLEGKAEGYCSPSGPIESTHCAYETVESLNKDLFPALRKLVSYPFFRHYKVDLYRECPFWYENGFCMNRACGVEAADESDIPDKWRAQALSQVRVSEAGSDPISSCYYREQDFCYIEDDATQDGQYFDLMLNPERFTGYAGVSAHHVWQAIYEENCFGLSEAAMDASKAGSSTPSDMVSALGGAGAGGIGFSKLSEGWGTEMIKGNPRDADGEETCEEKRVYYRVISGLHASISIHICHDYLDQTTGEWAPNLQCFITRLASHPERLSNVYFNAVLLARAIARAAPYLEAYDIGTAPTGKMLDSKADEQCLQDHEAKESLSQVLGLVRGDEMQRAFDEGDFFTSDDAPLLKEQFKTHFRNVSRIMDCVGCDKCRLWGKLQVSGLGTALKILFELDEKALDPKVNPDLLQRSEVVALFNTFHRTSESLAAVDEFRQMYAETQASAVESAKRKVARQDKRASRVFSYEACADQQKRVPGASGKSRQSTQQQGLSVSAVLGACVSAIEAFRRGCRGCMEICWNSLEKGRLGELLGRAGDILGIGAGRPEL